MHNRKRFDCLYLNYNNNYNKNKNFYLEGNLRTVNLTLVDINF